MDFSDPYLGHVFKLENEAVVEVINGPIESERFGLNQIVYVCRYREEDEPEGETIQLSPQYLDERCSKVY